MKQTSKKGLVLFLALSSLSLAGCSESNDKDIVILYTNDVHCGVNDNIGYAGLSYLKKSFESEGNYVGLVDCGDAIQGDFIGTVSKGEYIIDIMNEVGYDLAIPGNHEFDYTAKEFLSLTKEADFPYVCCNLTYTSNGENVFDSYKIMDFGKTKVAFVGILTPNTISSSTPTKFYGESEEVAYDFANGEDGQKLYKDVQDSVDQAKKEGADYVVALSHLGVDESDAPYRSTDVIKNTTGIDAVLDGHSHTVINDDRVKNKDGEYVLLSQTGTKLANVGELVINKSGNLSVGLISKCEGKDEETTKAIEDIEKDYQEQLTKVVAHTDYDLSIYDLDNPSKRISRRQETSLGDLITDAYRYYGQTDIAFQNGGGIRDNLKKGDLTYGDIYKVTPFGNNVVSIEATGQQIKDALEVGVCDLPAENGSFLDVSGMSYEVDTSKPNSVTFDNNGMAIAFSGDYRVKNLKIGGQDIDLSKTYTITSFGYILLQQGGGRMMFDGCKVIKNEGYLDVDCIIDYIDAKLGGNIGEAYKNNTGEGRIIID